MTTYATLTDMYQRYSTENLALLADGKIADITQFTYDELTDERAKVIHTALSDATSTIDGYIDGRAILPLQVIPSVLVRIACVLARYSLEDGVATEKATKDHDDAIRLLEKVASGEVSLGLSQTAERPEGGDTATITSGGSVWGREKSKGFI